MNKSTVTTNKFSSIGGDTNTNCKRKALANKLTVIAKDIIKEYGKIASGKLLNRTSVEYDVSGNNNHITLESEPYWQEVEYGILGKNRSKYTNPLAAKTRQSDAELLANILSWVSLKNVKLLKSKIDRTGLRKGIWYAKERKGIGFTRLTHMQAAKSITSRIIKTGTLSSKYEFLGIKSLAKKHNNRTPDNDSFDSLNITQYRKHNELMFQKIIRVMYEIFVKYNNNVENFVENIPDSAIAEIDKALYYAMDLLNDVSLMKSTIDKQWGKPNQIDQTIYNKEVRKIRDRALRLTGRIKINPILDNKIRKIGLTKLVNSNSNGTVHIMQGDLKSLNTLENGIRKLMHELKKH